jgi:hypothetical protein
MSLQPALGETITVGFITSGQDSAVVVPDALPTCEVMEDTNDTPIFTPIVINRPGKTGEYRVTIPLTSGNNFHAGRCYEIYGMATIGGKNAKAKLENFILRKYSIDGVNVIAINDIISVVDPVPVGTLTPGERSAIAVEVKTNVGNDTTMGSMGQQSKDMYEAMKSYGGQQITGKIDGSPTPTRTGFNVTLDNPLSAGKTIAGIEGQICTIRGGDAITEGNPIATCTINSSTNISLTFTGTNIFSTDPAMDDPVSISE